MRRRLLTLIAAAGLAAAPAVIAGPAHAAAPAGSFEVDYDAVGSSHLATPNATVALGPTTAVTYVSDSGDGTFTGSLPLPPTKASFNALGLLPVTATVTFIPAAPLTGAISQDLPLRLTATASYYLKLTDVTAAGLPASVGDSCQTAQPVVIPVATPAGQSFDLTAGGTLTGTYSIGEFANCGLTTALINSQVEGGGNTVSLALSNGRFVA